MKNIVEAIKAIIIAVFSSEVIMHFPEPIISTSSFSIGIGGILIITYLLWELIVFLFRKYGPIVGGKLGKMFAKAIKVIKKSSIVQVFLQEFKDGLEDENETKHSA